MVASERGPCRLTPGITEMSKVATTNPVSRSTSGSGRHSAVPYPPGHVSPRPCYWFGLDKVRQETAIESLRQVGASLSAVGLSMRSSLYRKRKGPIISDRAVIQHRFYF